MREKVIVKKKGCPKDDLPEKPVRSSFFFTTDFAGRRGTAAGHRGRASRHRGRAQIPKIRGPRGSNTQNQGSQGLKYPKTGVPARLWRIFSGNPLSFIRSKIRPNIRKIRNFGSGIRKIRIHPLVGTPAVLDVVEVLEPGPVLPRLLRPHLLVLEHLLDRPVLPDDPGGLPGAGRLEGPAVEAAVPGEGS